jgi:hypothetical protein
MHRSWTHGLLPVTVGFASLTHAAAGPLCRPALAFKHVTFSPMQPPAMRRTWTAVVAVDASGCAADARGRFQIVFTRLQEFGLDTQSREEFTWAAPEVTVTINLAATEAVERYRIGMVEPCPCAP